MKRSYPKIDSQDRRWRIALCVFVGGSIAMVATSCDSRQNVAKATVEARPTAELVYKSNQDSFGLWRKHTGEATPAERYIVRTTQAGSPAELEMFSIQGSEMAANMTLRGLLHGTIEFEYQVLSSSAVGENIFVFAIPIQDRTDGTVEAGFSKQQDSGNAKSSWRQKFTPPRSHYGDGLWHNARLDYDFRRAPGAAHLVVAPRINEGYDGPPSSARVKFRNVSVYRFK